MKINLPSIRSVALLCLLAACGCRSGPAIPPAEIKPGEVWPDDRGQQIQAHGGGILKLGRTYYWFGEDRARDNQFNLRYVSCYSSEDSGALEIPQPGSQAGRPGEFWAHRGAGKAQGLSQRQDQEVCHVHAH